MTHAIVNKPKTILDGVRVEVVGRTGSYVKVRLLVPLNASSRAGDTFHVKPSQLIATS